MAKHPELTGDFLHVPGYVQSSDPGAVGAGKLWVDTSAGPSNYVSKIRNPANTAWIAVSGGGVGATNFPGLTDTPASYAGAANYKVVVNGTATGLIFIPDAGGGSFLPLAGGVMTGDIDFNDSGEGIRFDDGAGVKFDGLIFDPATPDGPEVIIGNVAPDVGGPPPVRANSPVFRIGNVPVGGGFAQMEVWSADGGGYVPIFTAFTDNPGDPLDLGLSDNALNLVGSEVRPTYGGADLALLSDAGGTYDPEAIPRMQIGSGQAYVSVVNGIAIDVFPIPGLGTPGNRICARDFIRFIRGGPTVLNYKLELLTWSDSGGGPPTMAYSSDPTSPLDLTADLDLNVGQTIIVRVWYQDNSTGDEAYVETYFLLQDNQGIIPPPGP